MQMKSMVEYCDAVIRKIKAADTEIQLTEVINMSTGEFESKNPLHKGTYVINMIVSLRAAKAEMHTAKERENADRAIEIYREYGTQYPELLF
jgi:hypothetical protein